MRKVARLKKRIGAGLLSAVMVSGLLTGICPITAKAGNNTGKAIYEKIMGISNTKPKNFDSDMEPFGHGDEDFVLIKQNELFSVRTYGDSRSIQSVDRIKDNTGEITPLTQQSGNPQDYSTAFSKTDAANYSFIQMTSFDPNNTKRKDHVAMVGVKKDGKVCVTVMNKDGGSLTVELGDAKWMTKTISGNDDMWDFNAMNFLSITAGDYNNDGHETLVVYACLDNKNYGLFEVFPDYNNGVYKFESAQRGMLHDQYHALVQNEIKDNSSEAQDVDNRLHCALDTGDLNGDGIDDLVALSYVGYLTSSYRSLKTKDLYRPLLTTRFGGSDVSNVTNDYNRRIGVWNKNNGESMVAAGLSVGDIDGDGYDETIVAGAKNKITDSDRYDIDNSKLVVGIYKFNTDVDISGQKDEWPNIFWKTDLAMNKWTSASLWTTQVGLGADTDQCDQSWPRISVETVAFDGKGKAEHIFINGQIYSWNPGENSDNDKFKSVMLPDYFNEKDDAADTVTASLAFIRSSAVGVFDDNVDGREQIVYVIGLAIGGAPAGRIRYMLGMIGGKYNEETRQNEYYFTSDATMSSNYYPTDSNHICDADARMNFAICAWDNDDDGLHAVFDSKHYVYTDPEVMAVLQAPPTFSGLDDATDGGGTTYTLTTSYEYGTSEGHSVSHSIAGVFQLDSDCVKIDASLGPVNNWSETFTNSLTTTEEYSFTATGEDQVVIYRTPVTIYRYITETNGQWKDSEGKYNYFDITVPGTPSREMMSLSSYNDFAEYYNEESKRLAREKDIDESKAPQLKIINDKWLGHEGDPLSYMQETDAQDGRIVLQSTPNTFEMGKSATGYAWSKENSHTKETTHSHGFNFDFTITFGLAVYFGVNTSLEYMHEFSSSQTNAEGVGASCQISNINEDKLAALGIPKTTAEEYGFKYQMVSWPSGITKKERIYDFDDNPDNDKFEDVPVPIYGYMLKDVKCAVPSVTDLSASFDQTEEGDSIINLKWSDPTLVNNPVGSFVIYQIMPDGKLEFVDEVDSDITSYTYTGLDGRSDYTFVVRSKGALSHVEGINSNKARIFSDSSGMCSIVLKETGKEKDIYTVKYLNGNTSELEILHGATVKEIKETGESADGKKTTFTIFFTDGTTSTFEVNNGSNGTGAKDGSDGAKGSGSSNVVIVSMEKISSEGNTSTYEVTYSDGTKHNISVINKVDPVTPGATVEVGMTLPVGEKKAEVVVKKTEVAYNGTTDKLAKSVEVPNTMTVGGVTYDVTQISKNAFKDNKNIETITIGDNVDTIGDNAFSGCSNLTTVTIGKNVTNIGTNAFANCKSLKTIIIPKNVKNIKNYAFKGNNNLKTIIVKTTKLTKKSVAKYAFKGVKSKVTVKVPKSKKKAYKTLFRKKGLPKKVKIK